jgi:hypothetical protein
MLMAPATSETAFVWCDWCGAEWEAGACRSSDGNTIWWDGSGHNQRCEEGSKYVGLAWTEGERAERLGEMFPGDP